MEKELAHSFNIQLSPEILGALKREQEKLSKLFSEQRFYDSSPHLAIATKFMSEPFSQEFITALKKEFDDDASWWLGFSDFKPAQTNDYIFLHLNAESRQKMFELHERAFRTTRAIGFEKPDSGKFRHFDYDPHISIIKVAPENLEKALATLKNDMSAIKMPVTKYVITRQTDDEKGFATFPIVCEISLK